MVPRNVQITDVSSTPPDEVPTRRRTAAAGNGRRVTARATSPQIVNQR